MVLQYTYLYIPISYLLLQEISTKQENYQSKQKLKKRYGWEQENTRLEVRLSGSSLGCLREDMSSGSAGELSCLGNLHRCEFPSTGRETKNLFLFMFSLHQLNFDLNLSSH